MSTRIPPGSPLEASILALLSEQAEAGSEHARGELAKLERARKEAKAVASRIRRDPVIRDTPPGSWELWVPGWHPGSANKREGKHWTARRKAKLADYEAVLAAKLLAGLDLDRMTPLDALSLIAKLKKRLGA